MELKFENKVLSCYRETVHQLKRIQESEESVVPDTDDDIGRIVSVQTAVFIKSKEIVSRGVTVSGEAEAVMLYINESENRVSHVRIKKPFTVEYEISDIPAESEAVVYLSISNAEARVLNPRKVSVTFEISSELSLYSPESTAVDVILPEEISPGLHFKFDSSDSELPVSVCEKTFVLNEQYIFPSEKSEAVQLLYEHCSFIIEDQQFIGSKVIIKGSVISDICYISAQEAYPIITRFTSAFSQIIDSGYENIESCTAAICLTSAYFELTDTIGGEKALDAEFHALIQLVGRRHVNLRYISDAYSNTMPTSCRAISEIITASAGISRVSTDINEELEISEDCDDILCIFLNLPSVNTVQGELSIAVNSDIIYKNSSGALSSARRVLTAKDRFNLPGAKFLSSEIKDMNIRPEGGHLSLRLKIELSFEILTVKEFSRIAELELDEEKKYDLTRFPTLSLVRQDEESIWELASSYHSSPEAIERSNSGREEEGSHLLMIPKEI